MSMSIEYIYGMDREAGTTIHVMNCTIYSTRDGQQQT